MGMIGNAPALGLLQAANLSPGAVVGNLGFTPFNKAGDAVSGPIDLAGNKFRDLSGIGKVYHNLTPHYDFYSGSAGAIVLDTTIPYNDSNMCAIKLAGYGYNTSHPWEISVGGYFGENSFYSLSAYSAGCPFASVLVARKTATNTMSFIFGTVGNVYGTTAFVERFLQSYSNQNASYANGWTMSRITSTSAYSSITNVPLFTPVSVLPAQSTGQTKAYVPGGLGYGTAAQGYYVAGWLQGSFSSANTYCHIKTSLWGGGAPSGNSGYIMGGFRITGYIYSTNNVDDLIQFHNWSGATAGLVRTCKASDVGNTVYVGSDGWIYLRLRSGQYAGYNVDLMQTPIYSVQDIRAVSMTYSDSAAL